MMTGTRTVRVLVAYFVLVGCAAWCQRDSMEWVDLEDGSRMQLLEFQGHSPWAVLLHAFTSTSITVDCGDYKVRTWVWQPLLVFMK